MARPSKLPQKKWDELVRRHANGEKAADLARAFKVSPTQISRRVSQVSQQAKDVAALVVRAELAYEALPVSQQCCVRTIADHMKGMQEDYAKGAALGLKTALRLQEIANMKAEMIDPDTMVTEDLRLVAALADTGNKASTMGTMLITNALRTKEDEGKTRLEDLIEQVNRKGNVLGRP